MLSVLAAAGMLPVAAVAAVFSVAAGLCMVFLAVAVVALGNTVNHRTGYGRTVMPEWLSDRVTLGCLALAATSAVAGLGL